MTLDDTGGVDFCLTLCDRRELREDKRYSPSIWSFGDADTDFSEKMREHRFDRG